jgi:hypothetical protein
MIFETAHQPLKQGMRKSNHRDEQVYAVGASLASDFESRLALQVQKAMFEGSPWTSKSCLQIEELLLGQCLNNLSTLPSGRTMQDIFEAPLLGILAGVRRRHCTSEISQDVWLHDKPLSMKEALELTAFPEEALKAMEWYIDMLESKTTENDGNTVPRWFRETSRYRMQALKPTGRPNWKRRAVARVGSFLQTVCGPIGDDSMQFLRQEGLDSFQHEAGGSESHPTSSLWHVIALIDNCRSDSGNLARDDDEFQQEAMSEPIAIVLPCSETLTKYGECHARVQKSSAPALIKLSSAVRETLSLHLCDAGTCVRIDLGRGVKHSPLPDKDASFNVFDSKRGYPPRIA